MFVKSTLLLDSSINILFCIEAMEGGGGSQYTFNYFEIYPISLK